MLRAALVTIALSAAPAFAQSVEDQVLMQLQAQGFVEITMHRTLLGRLRVVATNERYRRELVINPNTGAILRDYWEETSDDAGDADDDVRVYVPDDDYDEDGDEPDDSDDEGEAGDNNGDEEGAGEDEDNDDDDDDDDEEDDDSDDEDDDD
ncbi:hypothetical protein [Roseovarius sp. SYSU LYC5161]|uniref:hypothetical protein n=1 Tax=Roseovarius halophilus (ex Wu et al. 2025) TaxID=3376060 RepID=UPI003999F858